MSCKSCFATRALLRDCTFDGIGGAETEASTDEETSLLSVGRLFIVDCWVCSLT
jgi:hypothetical protein